MEKTKQKIQIKDKFVLLEGFQTCNKCHINTDFGATYNTGDSGQIVLVSTERGMLSVLMDRESGYSTQYICVKHVDILNMARLFQTEPFKSMRKSYERTIKRNTRKAKKD